MRDDGDREVDRRPPYALMPVRWEMVYPLEVEPLGEVVFEGGEYRARFRAEDLGYFDTGDEAAKAIWTRFIDHVHARHDIAAHTHGSAERHPR